MGTFMEMIEAGEAATHDAVSVERPSADRATVTLNESAEAKEMGLVHEVVGHDELLGTADGWADRIAALAPHALAMSKPLLRQCADASWDTALAIEEFAEPNCFTTERFGDAVRGMRGA